MMKESEKESLNHYDSINSVFEDRILGLLKPMKDDYGWEVEFGSEDEQMKIEVCGDPHPDESLLAHAREIFTKQSSFKSMVKKFLDRKKSKFPKWLHKEIEALKIETVSLWDSDHPEEGTIYFKGLDSPRVWQCEFTGLKFKSLGFDR